MTTQTHAFQTETKQILDLMIHSLYSHKEIFIRELISNASDAIEKLKLLSLTQPELKDFSATDFKINLLADPAQKLLIFEDNGLGMTREEVIKNLGTIAHSGTKAFLTAKKDSQSTPEALIGQFGVGFYSAFMVADRVTVVTRKAGTTEATLWESTADGNFQVSEATRAEQGTTITLHLKDFKSTAENTDATKDFTDSYELRTLIKKYSDFIAYPIILRSTQTPEGKKTTATEEGEVVNSQIALWTKPAHEVTPEQYQTLYQSLSFDWQAPEHTIHFKAEGTSEFSAILFIPKKKAFNYNMRDFKTSIKLYVKRVLIQSETDFLVPLHFRFISGIVDSEDLPLNISRETLQHNVQISRIRKALTNKIISTLKDLMDKNRASYEQFWAEFGTTLKEGTEIGALNSESDVAKIKDLFLFQSSEGKSVSLREYTDRMKPDQKDIYFISGESLTQIQNSPYLEKLTSRGLEVLFFTDRVDVWMLSNIQDYDGKKLVSITSDKLELPTSEEQKKKEQEEKKSAQTHFATLIETMQKSLSASVSKVEISDRLTDSAVCLVASGGYDAHAERLIKAMGQQVHSAQRILEINPKHPVFEKMLLLPEGTQKEWSQILYQQALLNEGTMIDDPYQYSKKITELLMSSV
jgi:molecular chaperone HtpG